MAKIIEGLYYSESHEYVRVEGEFGYVGITDYAQSQLATSFTSTCPPKRTKLPPAKNSEP